MARTRMGRKRNKMMECEGRWVGLDVNLLQKVFQSIPTIELLSSVSLVCRQWRLVCCDTLFWKDEETLELSTLKSLVGDPIYFAYSYKLLRALECMMYWAAKMEHHQGRCVRSIIFAPYMLLRGADLTFVADRSPKLKRLILPDNTHSIDVSISRAITKWRELEELSTGPIENARAGHLFRTIGSNCKHFTKLHIFGSASRKLYYFNLDYYNASIIVQNLHQLKEFNIDEAIILKSGLEILLSESKNLEELNLKSCCGLANPIIDLILWLPLEFLKDRISAKISRKIAFIPTKRKMHGDGAVSNCAKYWTIVSNSIRETWGADELVNHMWAESCPLA